MALARPTKFESKTTATIKTRLKATMASQVGVILCVVSSLSDKQAMQSLPGSLIICCVQI